jgi:hypothetical protein
MVQLFVGAFKFGIEVVLTVFGKGWLWGKTRGAADSSGILSYKYGSDSGLRVLPIETTAAGMFVSVRTDGATWHRVPVQVNAANGKHYARINYGADAWLDTYIEP